MMCVSSLLPGSCSERLWPDRRSIFVARKPFVTRTTRCIGSVGTRAMRTRVLRRTAGSSWLMLTTIATGTGPRGCRDRGPASRTRSVASHTWRAVSTRAIAMRARGERTLLNSGRHSGWDRAARRGRESHRDHLAAGFARAARAWTALAGTSRIRIATRTMCACRGPVSIRFGHVPAAEFGGVAGDGLHQPGAADDPDRRACRHRAVRQHCSDAGLLCGPPGRGENGRG